MHPGSDEAIKQIIEKSKSRNRIVFVSGNFNIVHPGHLRLLRYAKECGDFLIVGVYPKDTPGAILPEELRFEGIKSISIVDFAFILHDRPEQFIRELKPAIVVKGKEHEHQINPEQNALNSYGGKLLFSSGDITFSSLDLLQKEFKDYNPSTIIKAPDFIKRHGFSLINLRDILSKMKNLKVIVVGDLIIDEYITCDPLGMSQEDPTIVVTPVATEKFVGGSAIVAAHAAGLGAIVNYYSVTGKDVNAEFATKRLNEYGVKAHLCIDENRPTSLKQRFRANGKTLLRVSHLRHNSIDKNIAQKMLQSILSTIEGTQLLIFSDFNYGCLPQFLVEEIKGICVKLNIMMVADSQSSSQTGDVSRFKYTSLLTPTEREARIAVRDFNSGLVVLAESLSQISFAKNLIITLGSEGILIYAPNSKEEFITDRLPALNTAPKDISGAGDSLIVCCSLAMATGANIWQSAYLGSLGAACQVGRIGNIPLSPKDIEFELLTDK